MRDRLRQGRSRRVLVSAALALLVGAVVFLGAFHAGRGLETALGILLVSLAGFHAIALATFDCTWGWKFVNYPWVLSTFMTILIALTNIYETARLTPVELAIEKRRQVYQELLFQVRNVLTNDCNSKRSHRLPYTAAPEPYDGACDRIEQFLPRIEDAAEKETSAEGLNSGRSWGVDITVRGTRPTGSWSELYASADRFERSSREVKLVLDDFARTPPSPIAAWARSEDLKYWYFVLAFFLGLRLSRITAEVLASRPGAGAPAAAEALQARSAEARTAAPRAAPARGPTAQRGRTASPWPGALPPGEPRGGARTQSERTPERSGGRLRPARARRRFRGPH